MTGPYLRLRGELGATIKGAWGTAVGWPWSTLVARNSPVAGRDTLPHLQVFGVRIEQSMGSV